MVNRQISDIFSQMADIMEILGEDHFRVSTYRKVARVVHDCGEDISVLIREKGLEELPGIGKSSAAKIIEFTELGSIQAHQRLLNKIPAGLLDLLTIPGMGPKGVGAVWKGLKVTSLEKLRKAIEDHRLEKLAGFGAKKAQSLARGIEFIKSSQGRILLSDASALADAVMEQLRGVSGLEKIVAAGSLRRCCETIGDIDLLAQAKDGREIIERFTHLGGVQDVLAQGETKGSIRFADKNICSDVVQVDLRVVPAKSMGAALVYFTGSKYHNVHMREMAGKKRLKLNEYGLYKGEKQIAGKSEEEIYEKLSLPYITPTLREDRGEIELAQKGNLPEIVELPDIRGDLHIHTPESDGRSSLEELIAASRQLGYKYIAITDHSQSSVIANGLDIDRLTRHIEYIKKVNNRLKDFTVLASSEVDILMDGTLDYPDEVLCQLDFVLASVHSGMKGEQQKLTDRITRAMQNRYVNCIGHPTGRMINIREPMQLDMEAIISQAVKTGTALEISASPYRLDLNDIHVRMAVEKGAKLIISTDAHYAENLREMCLGVATAQRGWAKKSDVLNCGSVRTINEWVKSKRDKFKD